MAFVVQDITGLSTANSMASVAEFDTYCLDRGVDVTGFADDTAKEVALVQGADYLKTVYYGSWKGDLVQDTQSTPFPRVIELETVFPDAIKYANIELALRANVEPLLTDIGQRVVEEQVSSIKVKYSEYSNEQQSYSAVYSILRPYLTTTSSFSIPVQRV